MRNRVLISYMHLNSLEITHAGMLKRGHYIDRNFILTGKKRSKSRKRYKSGTDPGGGGGGSWGSRQPPPPLLGDPKLHKEGKNVVRVRMKMQRFSSKLLPGLPLSEILYPPL